jgi:hypothetical protein
MRHMAALEPSQVGRRGLKPRDTWQRRSPPEQGSRVQSSGARGCAEGLLSREARSGVVGHVAVRPAPCLGLKPVCRGTYSRGTDNAALG